MARKGSSWGVLVLLLLPGYAGAVEPREWRPCARIETKEIDECSGVVRSRRHEGVFWVNNDSGDLPRLFALNRSGQLLREVRIQGARNVDWEDVTLDDAGHLYIGDFGNNRNERQDLKVYIVEEPDPRAAGDSVLTIPVLRAVPFYFPEQKAFPDPEDFNYDCEAMFWDAGNLYLLTKHRSDARTVLYRLSVDGDSLRAAVRLGETEIGSQVTAAALSEDRRYLVVLSYQYIDVFERPPVGDHFLAQRRHRMVIEGRQCEGICFDGQDVLFTNEQREIYCLPLRDLLAGEAYLPIPPLVRIAAVAPRLDGRNAGWERVESLPLWPEAEEGVRESFPPEVRLGWCPEGLLLSIRWPTATTGPGTLLFTVMFGPPGDAEPRLQKGQQVWEARAKKKKVELRRVHPDAPEPLAGRSFRSDSPLRVDVLLPALLSHGETLLLNVLVADLEVPSRSWAWAGSRSTQPEENPLLWGRAILQP